MDPYLRHILEDLLAEISKYNNREKEYILVKTMEGGETLIKGNTIQRITKEKNWKHRNGTYTALECLVFHTTSGGKIWCSTESILDTLESFPRSLGENIQLLCTKEEGEE